MSNDERDVDAPPGAVVLAENAVLGIVLDKPDLAGRAFSRVAVEDFTGPRRLIAEAIHGMRLARRELHHVALIGEMQRRGTIGRIGGPVTITNLVSAFTRAAFLGSYLNEIVTDVRRRRAYALAASLLAESSTDKGDPLDAARRALTGLQGLLDAADADSAEVTIPTLREFLDTEDAPYDWVIPGLLERGDRFILTGSEGLGKSALMRQLAICTAAGVHPFTAHSIPPQPVLVIDCENGATPLRRVLRGLATQARLHGGGADENLWIEARPEGLDLTRPADEAWLVRTVATIQPAVLITGSLYRLHAKNPNDEEPARAVTRVLDRCRSAANCAVILEAHSPHATAGAGPRPVRPVGSSLWLRWPEFGYGLRPTKDYTPETRVVDFVPWRGDRDERKWPKRLKAGGAWPWSEATYSDHNSWGAA